MKRSLVFLIVVLGLNGSSFSMLLDEPLFETSGLHGTCKDAIPSDSDDPRTTDFRYEGRSQIGGLDYPKMTMVHSYNQEGEGGDNAQGVPAPFSAIIPSSMVNAPSTLQDSSAKKFFSFVVQGIEKGRKLTPKEVQVIQDKEAQKTLSPQDLSVQRYYVGQDGHHLLPRYSLKPQYFLHSDCSTLCTENQVKGKILNHTLQWTVIPGTEGRLVPEKGAGLHQDSVSTHRHGSKRVPIAPRVRVEDLKERNPKEYERITGIMQAKGIVADTAGYVDMDVINDVPMAQRMRTRADQAKVQADASGMVNLHEIEGAAFKDDLMILSGDVMHVSGMTPCASIDSYDLVAFGDNAAITYRWQLAGEALDIFNTLLEGANTFRELIVELEKEVSFSRRLAELKKYIGLLPREESAFAAVPQGWSFEGFAANDSLKGTLSLNTPVDGIFSRLWIYKDSVDANSTVPQWNRQPWEVKEGQIITVSFEVKNLKGSIAFGLTANQGGQQYGANITDNGKKEFSFTVPAGIKGLTPILYNRSTKVSLDVEGIKVTITDPK